MTEAAVAPQPADSETQADPAAAAAERRRRWQRWGPVAALAAVLLLLSIALANPPGTGLPLDPTSTQPLGTKALRLVLERLGGDVRILDDLPGADVDTLLVLDDNFDEAGAQHVRTFVRNGGVALVVDIGGALGEDLRQGPPATVGMLETSLPRRCELPAVAAAEEVAVGAAATLFVPPGATGCFTRDEEGETAWLLAQPLGQGHLVHTGGPGFLTNSLLGEADNAYVAAALLVPEPGTTVGILSPAYSADAPVEDASLIDLIPERLQLAALQLFGAFLLLVLWRGRRLGKPVAEVQEVRLPGSELVIAVGHLLQRTGSAQRAAQLLRGDLRRELAQRLGVPEHMAAEGLADAAAARSGLAAPDVLAAVDGPPPASDSELVALAHDIERIRRALTSSATAGA